MSSGLSLHNRDDLLLGRAVLLLLVCLLEERVSQIWGQRGDQDRGPRVVGEGVLEVSLQHKHLRHRSMLLWTCFMSLHFSGAMTCNIRCIALRGVLGEYLFVSFLHASAPLKSQLYIIWRGSPLTAVVRMLKMSPATMRDVLCFNFAETVTQALCMLKWDMGPWAHMRGWGTLPGIPRQKVRTPLGKPIRE